MKKINRLLEKSINLEDYEKIYGQLPTSLSKSALMAQQLEEEEAQESEYESSEEDPSQDVMRGSKGGIPDKAKSTTIGQQQPVEEDPIANLFNLAFKPTQPNFMPFGGGGRGSGTTGSS